jgi:hypothetical protein
MQITKRRNVIRVAGILLLGHAVGWGETASREGGAAGKPPDPTHEVFLAVVRAGQSTGVTIARGLPTAFGMKLKPRADQEIWVVRTHTRVCNDWIAAKFGMGHPGSVIRVVLSARWTNPWPAGCSPSNPC